MLSDQAVEQDASGMWRRYIWLPMWVVEVPGAGGEDLMVAAQRKKRRRRFRHMRLSSTVPNITLPPMDVVVR